MQASFSSIREQGFAVHSPFWPNKKAVVGIFCSWGATQHRHRQPRHEAGVPCGVWSPGANRRRTMGGGSGRELLPATLASPGLLKLLIRWQTLHPQRQSPFPSSFQSARLAGPWGSCAHPAGDEASPSLPTLLTAGRLLHQEVWEIILLQPLASTLVQKHFSITEHLD